MSSTGIPVEDLGLPGRPARPLTAAGRGRWRRTSRHGTGRARTLAGRVGGPALAVTYLSLLVLLPLAAVVAKAFSGGWSTFWAEVTNPLAVSALELTLALSAIVAVVNSIAGLAISWVLVRDDFPGKPLVSALIDLPFACRRSSPASRS